MLQAVATVGDVFGLKLPEDIAYRWKRYVTAFYKPLYTEILQNILSSPVIHIDETTVKLRNNRNGYVWVITSLDAIAHGGGQLRKLTVLLRAFSMA